MLEVRRGLSQSSQFGTLSALFCPEASPPDAGDGEPLFLIELRRRLPAHAFTDPDFEKICLKPTTSSVVIRIRCTFSPSEGAGLDRRARSLVIHDRLLARMVGHWPPRNDALLKSAGATATAPCLQRLADIVDMAAVYTAGSCVPSLWWTATAHGFVVGILFLELTVYRSSPARSSCAAVLELQPAI